MLCIHIRVGIQSGLLWILVSVLEHEVGRAGNIAPHYDTLTVESVYLDIP